MSNMNQDYRFTSVPSAEKLAASRWKRFWERDIEHCICSCFTKYASNPISNTNKSQQKKVGVVNIGVRFLPSKNSFQNDLRHMQVLRTTTKGLDPEGDAGLTR